MRLGGGTVDSVECPAWRRRPGTLSRVGGENHFHGPYEPPLRAFASLPDVKSDYGNGNQIIGAAGFGML
jgi:hypothetical protein